MIGKSWAWGALAVALLGGAAKAQALHSLSPKDMIWKAKPTGNDVARYYPEEAQRSNRSGWSVIECRTETSGDLKDCQVLGEAPAGARFGEAGLALMQYFKIDASKTPPDRLANGVVAVPIVMTVEGAPIPLRNISAGEPSLLLSPSAAGRTPCPGPSAPDQVCTAHRFAWAVAPTLVEAAPFIRAAAASPPTTRLLCPISADMKLGECTLTGPADPSQVDAMEGLLPGFSAPAKAEDTTPTKGGFMLMQFDWPALKHAVETSVLTRRP